MLSSASEIDSVYTTRRHQQPVFVDRVHSVFHVDVDIAPTSTHAHGLTNYDGQSRKGTDVARLNNGTLHAEYHVY